MDEMNKENSSAETEKNGAASSRTSAEQAAQMLAAALTSMRPRSRRRKAKTCPKNRPQAKPLRRPQKAARRTSLLLNVRSIKRGIKPTAKTGKAKNLRSPHPPWPRKSLRSRPRSVQGAYSSNFSIY